MLVMGLFLVGTDVFSLILGEGRYMMPLNGANDDFRTMNMATVRIEATSVPATAVPEPTSVPIETSTVEPTTVQADSTKQAPEPTATTQPTAVPTSTLAPTVAPTATPEPTATQTAIPEPTVAPWPAYVEEVIAETLAQEMLEFPAALEKGSDRLQSDEAIAAWVEYIGGVRLFSEDGFQIEEFCSDGTGSTVYLSGAREFAGATFTYEVISDPGGSWNTAIASIIFSDAVLHDVKTRNSAKAERFTLAGPGTLNYFNAYVSPACD
jgi:hypothetical protein